VVVRIGILLFKKHEGLALLGSSCAIGVITIGLLGKTMLLLGRVAIFIS
jgi:hypothetical protein